MWKPGSARTVTLDGVGAKQICSEQISFLLKGGCTALLPSIVFSHLDSDLPFYLWWQEEFRDPMDPQLWTWVDRVIYDSQHWKDFRAQMGLLESAEQEANQRIVLCDLNWTRLDNVRFALAQFFDHPASRHHFAKINKFENRLCARLPIDRRPFCRVACGRN